MVRVIRPLPKELPSTLINLRNYLLENVKPQDPSTPKSEQMLSVCGGFVRDFIYDVKYNDYDLIYSEYRNAIPESSVGIELYIGKDAKLSAEDPSNPHTQIVFHDNSGESVNIHFINDFGLWEEESYGKRRPYIMIQPTSFDCSINEVHIDLVNGFLYATPETWFDVDNRIVRINDDKAITSNIAIRVLRIAAKCNLTIDKHSLELILAKFRLQHLNEEVILKGLKKSVDDGVGDKVFEWLNVLGYPNIEKFSNMNEFIDDMIMRKYTFEIIASEPIYSDSYDDEE